MIVQITFIDEMHRLYRGVGFFHYWASDLLTEGTQGHPYDHMELLIFFPTGEVY